MHNAIRRSTVLAATAAIAFGVGASSRRRQGEQVDNQQVHESGGALDEGA